MTTRILTDMRNQGKAKKYCYKTAEMCFSSNVRKDAVHDTQVLYLDNQYSDTLPAMYFVLQKYYFRNIALIECIIETKNKNYHFFITTLNENMNPIHVIYNDDMKAQGDKSIRAKVSRIYF